MQHDLASQDQMINREAMRTFWCSVLINIFYLVAISDITSVNLGGGNVRLAWVILPFLVLILPKGKNPKIIFILVAMLIATHILAAFTSGLVIKGLVYSAWICFNYFFFFRAAYVLTTVLQERVWTALLWGGRVQIILAIGLVLLGFHERAQFIYFEPSYLAIGLVPYLFATLYWSGKKWLDAGFLMALLIFNQSANMMVAILVAILFWLFTNRRKWLSASLVALVFLAGYSIYKVALGDPSNPNHGVATWIADEGISLDMFTAVLSRAGNRVPRIQAALEMLDGHWLAGFGPSVYIELTANRSFMHLTDGLVYLDPAGLPVVNVLLEAVTNAGVAAAALLVFIFLHVIHLVFTRVSNKLERNLMIGALLAFALMLQFESSYLRAYVWLAFGVFVARALHHVPSLSLLNKSRAI